MKIGIISDIHSNVYGLEAVLKELEDSDVILCAGDLTGYYTFINEVFEMIDRYKVKFIKGNHDEYLFQEDISKFNNLMKGPLIYTKNEIYDENLKKLEKTNKCDNIVIDGLKITIYHGSPWNELEEYIYPDFDNFEKFKEIEGDLIILGHTHYPMIKKIGKLLVVNPGSCGQPRDGDPRAAYAIFDTQTHEISIKRTKYNIQKVCEGVMHQGFDKKLVDILKKGAGGMIT